MKKLVRTNLTNSPTRRGTENLNIQFYSHDRNNAGFEFVVSNESDLTSYTAKVLFNFIDSASTWETNGTIEGNIIKVAFNTNLIARCEEVLGYLFLDSDSDSLDVFKFKFNVVLSEIDKGEVANRQIKHVNNIGELELVTRSQLKDELSKLQINGVDLTNYLTTTVADERYAQKQELRSYALSKDVPSINGLVTEEQLKTANNGVLEEVKKLGYAKTTDIPAAYNDSELAGRVTNLETKVDKDTVYDDSDLKSRVQVLENRPAPANTTYDDSEVKRRLADLETRPAVDTSKFLTDETLTAKKFVTKDELNTLKPNQTLTINNNTLSIAGGNSVLLPSNKPLTGSGTPEGNVIANPGDTYVNKNVSLGDYFYYKERNPGKNTGWKVLYGSMGVNINLTTGGRIRFARENYFVNASISDLTISLDALNSGQGRDFYQDGENVVIRFIPSKQFDARESIIPQGFRPYGSFLVPAYSKSGDSIGLFKFEQTYGIVKLILNDVNKDNVTSEMLKGINSGLIVYPTQEAWMTKLP